MKAYGISLAPSSGRRVFDAPHFEEQLSLSDQVVAWLGPWANAYIVIVKDDVRSTEIANLIVHIDPTQEFLVVWLDLEDHAGRIPKLVRDWLDQYRGANGTLGIA